MDEINPQNYDLQCAVWELTLLCNLRCIHCGSTAETQRKDELTTEEGLKLLEDLKSLDCGGVALMGGEPLVRKDWTTLAEAVKQYDMKLSVITNGMLVKDGNLEKLVRLQPDVVGVSIDGATAETHDKIRGRQGSFDNALGAVYALRGEGVPVTIITSLNKLNVYELDGIKDLIAGRGIGWQVQVVTCNGGRFTRDLMLSPAEFYFTGLKVAGFRSQYSLEELPVVGAHDLGYHSCVIPGIMNESEWSGCQAGITNIGIQSNGNVKGCLSLPDEFVEGNIRQRSLRDIWFDPKAFKVNRHFQVSDLGGYCSSCEYGKSCQGGCSDVAHNLTGQVHNNPFCFYRIEKEQLNGGK